MQEAKPTLSTHPNKIQSQNSGSQGSIQISLTWHQGKEICATSVWKVWFHSCAIGRPYQRDHGTSHSTPGLPNYPRRSCTCIHQKQHDPSSTQQCKLPQWTKSKEPRQRSLLHIIQVPQAAQQWCHPQHSPHNQNIMSSATDAELLALYTMTRELVYICIILEEIGYRQPLPQFIWTMQWQIQRLMGKYNQNKLRP